MNDSFMEISPVRRSKRDAMRYYDRISRYYDLMAGAFERKYALVVLEALSIQRGEKVLEVGIGTGHCMRSIVRSTGKSGMACGIDISMGMLAVSKKRLGDTSLLCCSDAAHIPYKDGTFDAVFISFTLELFDTPEIPVVLAEIARVLKDRGRLGVVSMSKYANDSIMVRIYEWLHKKWPAYFDCRPIYLEKATADAGFSVQNQQRASLFGLPLQIVIAEKL